MAQASETSTSEPRTSPTSPTTPTPPTPRGPELSRRLKRLGVSGRRLRREWTRQRILEIVRTLAWTVPLTLLLWVWAQDQQVDEQSLSNINLSVAHVDPQRVALPLASGSPVSEDRVRTMAGPIPIAVTVRGPHANVVEALRPLRDGLIGLSLELSGEPTERTAIDLRQRLNEMPHFVNAGVTVVAVSPATIDVRVDQVVSREVPVVAGYGPLAETEIVGTPVFEPSEVTIRGPSRAIAAMERLAGGDGPVVVATLESAVQTPGATVGEQTQDLRVQFPPDLLQRLTTEGVPEARSVRIEPDLVTARFVRRDREFTEHTLAVVPLTIDKPSAMEGRYVVKRQNVDLYRLDNVKIRGPKELIDQIAAANGSAAIQARLKIFPEDRFLDGQEITRQVVFELPPDVQLVDEPPTVTFVLEPVANTTP